MKISYFKRWDNNGYTYTQGITMKREEFERVCDAIDAELAQGMPRKPEYVHTSGYEIFLKPLRSHNNGGNIYFTTHVTRDFINLLLKLPLKDRNTYVRCIK